MGFFVQMGEIIINSVKIILFSFFFFRNGEARLARPNVNRKEKAGQSMLCREEGDGRGGEGKKQENVLAEALTREESDMSNQEEEERTRKCKAGIKKDDGWVRCGTVRPSLTGERLFVGRVCRVVYP